MRQMRLHTEVFEHRCLDTQKHLHRDTLTYTRLYTQKLLYTGCFSENTEALTENILHTEAFTHRKLSTEAFTQRSFYTQMPLHTEACTHGGFYTQKLLHREALHRAAFTRFKIANLLGVWYSAIMSCERVKSGVLTLDNHFASKGCAWLWKIVIYNNLHTFYFAWRGCAWRFKIDKVAFLHLILEHLHLASQNGSFSTAIAVWLSCHACMLPLPPESLEVSWTPVWQRQCNNFCANDLAGVL